MKKQVLIILLIFVVLLYLGIVLLRNKQIGTPLGEESCKNLLIKYVPDLNEIEFKEYRLNEHIIPSEELNGIIPIKVGVSGDVIPDSEIIQGVPERERNVLLYGNNEKFEGCKFLTSNLGKLDLHPFQQKLNCSKFVVFIDYIDGGDYYFVGFDLEVNNITQLRNVMFINNKIIPKEEIEKVLNEWLDKNVCEKI